MSNEIIRNEENSILQAGDIVTINGIRYRVLNADKIITVVQLDTTKLNINYLDRDVVITSIYNGEYTHEKYIEPDVVVDKNNKKYVQRVNMISDIKDKYAGDIIEFVNNHSPAFIENMIQKHGIKSITTFWYIVRSYIQGGLCYSSLMPIKHKYPNRIFVNYIFCRKDSNGRDIYKMTRQDFANMDEVIDMYKNKKFTSLHKAYKYLYTKYYNETVIDDNGKSRIQVKPYGQKPTERQFQHYYYSVTDVMDRKRSKKSDNDILNNDRVLSGGHMEDAPYPGALVEIDACELNISLIGTYRPQCSIGGATLYVMKDVYSKLILAMSLGFTKNSREALFKLFANLAADKTAFCERYGIKGVTPELWPSGIIPTRVRCDRGSDFKSIEFSRVCEELGTIKDLVRGASGSMKGDVESFFNMIQNDLANFTNKHGLILSEYGSKHKTDAVLNILDLQKMCILYILYYNSHVMNEYPSTIEMEEAKIKLSPISIWNFGIENFGSPMPISNKEQYLHTLLMRSSAKINRKGIHFNGLIYFTLESKELMETMLKNKDTKTNIQILYDPNNIHEIKYVRSDGTYEPVPLNTSLPQYKGLNLYTFSMWKTYLKEKNKRLGVMKEEDETMTANYTITNQNIINDAVAASPVKPSTKNMKENRKFETEMDAPRESVSSILSEVQEQKALEEQSAVLIAIPGENRDTSNGKEAINTETTASAETPNDDPEDEYDDGYDPEEHLRSLYI